MNKTVVCLFAFCLSTCCFSQLQTVDAVTFNDEKTLLYLPLREVGKALDWPVLVQKGEIYLNKKRLAPTYTRRLPDGDILLSLKALKDRGLAITYDSKRKLRKIRIKNRAFYARKGQKRVVINKSAKQLAAFQGSRVVMRVPIGYGRAANQTPNGIFEVQPYRTRFHRSRLYKVGLPWAMQVVGNIFLHGDDSGFGQASSHGCIRVPMTGRNPARWLYHWAETGTPVAIQGNWPKGAKG